MRLEGKTAVITGAASGIGAACAALFKSQGATVLGIDLKQDSLTNVKASLNASVALDVTAKASVDAAISDFAQEFGHLDILINSAGITSRNVPEGTSWEDGWQMVMDVNVKGTLLISAAMMEHQRATGRGGSIVTISSIYGQVSRPPILTGPPDPYTHSKGAILQLTRDLAVSGAPDRIRVNSLCPGFIRTPLTKGLREDNAIHSHLVSLHPLGRLGEPHEVAQCALFLASDESSFVTGTSLAVDGGYLAV